jgi:hypothetical protein
MASDFIIVNDLGSDVLAGAAKDGLTICILIGPRGVQKVLLSLVHFF